MINFKKSLFILFILLFILLKIMPDNNKYRDIEVKNKFRLKIPENWFFEDYTDEIFNVYNYDFRDINNQFSILKSNWIKVEVYYYSNPNSSLNKEVEKAVEIYDKVIKKEEFEMDNGNIGFFLICESIPPNMNDIFIVYYDGFKVAIIYCWPSYTEYKKEFFEIVKFFNFIYYTPKVDNLRFKASADFKGKFIRSFTKGEKLELLEKGKTETIQGTKGTWVKVRTEKGEEGWCFDAYLEEVKN